MTITRRTLITAGATAGLAAAAGATPAFADPFVNPHKSGLDFGPLIPQGDLALPRGFAYQRVGTIGVEDLLDGPGGRVVGTTPGLLDGTGCFGAPDGHRLVRNHECRASAAVTVPLVAGTVYDAGVPTGMGGCTVVRTRRDGSFVEQWVGLSGTIRNCAGGETPWGSWLSCEEDLTRAGTVVTNAAGQTFTTQQDHGYVFEVFPKAPATQIPEPIKAWGRAVWEGAAIGPERTDAYLTEDTGGGLFYRWTAPEGKEIKPGIARRFGADEGTLQAAQLVRGGTALVHYWQLTAADLNKPYPVRWVAGGADRQAQTTDLRKQFPGATVHPKIEGCWSDGQGLWFTASYSYDSEQTKYPQITQNQGMVLFYDFEDQTLTLKIYYELGNRFDGPDNITVSPFGTIVIAEDGDDQSHLISWTPGRGSQALALNLMNDLEWAGPAFDPRGEVLYASIQGVATYAITGPFKRYLGGR